LKILSEPIDAVVRFRAGADQKPLPYKFRYRDDCANLFEVKIDRIFKVEEWKLAGIRSLVYRCASVICGAEKVYELRYIVDECRWELYKM